MWKSDATGGSGVDVRVGVTVGVGVADGVGLSEGVVVGDVGVDLVADGHPNKEIAAMLFVTVKTVEGKLTQIYAKLGVRSRTELARLVGRERPVEEDRSAMGRVFPPGSQGR